MSKRRSLQLNESSEIPDTVTVSITNSPNKRVRTEVQNTKKTTAFKEKFEKVSQLAEKEEVEILANTLSNMETSIQAVQDSINRLESNLRKIIKEEVTSIVKNEVTSIVKNEIQKGFKNLKIVYEEN